MFGRYTISVFVVLAAAALVVPLAGCGKPVDKFAKLDIDESGYLTPEELDINNDGFITPEEIDHIGQTYPRTVEQFFRHGGATPNDMRLDREQFARALQGDRMAAWEIALILVLVVGIPIPIGFQLAKMLRMPDHGWKLAVVLLSLTAGGTVAYFGWPPHLGIDLSGGVILIYEIDEEATAEQFAEDPADRRRDPGEPEFRLTPAEHIDIDDLVGQLRRRINPGGVKEIVVRPYGTRQVEIIIPEVDAAEVDPIKRLVARAGQLEFLIVATDRRHRGLIDQAMRNVADPQRLLRDADGNVHGRWVPVGVDEIMRGKKQDYRGVNPTDVLRARKGRLQDFEPLDLPPAIAADFSEGRLNFREAVERSGYRDLQALMWVDPNSERNVKGGHLRSATSGWDTVGNPAVHFRMNQTGAMLLGRLTSQHQPDRIADFYYRMAIIMDGEVISAPRLLSVISSDGQITGDFTQTEVDELASVLNAGRLPAVLRKDPISQNQVSALLGYDTIRSGAIAISLSLAAVLVFMLIYYRFAGIVACAALLVNLLLIMSLMILLGAALTLPGLAGLVLTVGMSVDANVLVFERIREELARGSALRMAIRNGFARATTTIVDANLTTLITAIVLYVIGTDQIRGFAVALILGILISMYTAIFCSRLVFDIAERRRWISRLGMTQLLGETQLDFLGRRRIAIVGSMVLILIGLVALFYRGRDIFDIDFNGGTSVQVQLVEPMAIADFRRIAEDPEHRRLGDVSVTGVHLTHEEALTTNRRQPGPGEYDVFIVNSSITGEGPPEVGDPVNYEPPGETEPIRAVVTAIDSEAQTATLQARVGTAVFQDVPWNRFDRDGVEIVQERIKQLFADKLEMRSLAVRSLAAVTGGRPTAPSPEEGEGAAAPKAAPDQTAALVDEAAFSLVSFSEEDAELTVPAEDAADDADAPAARVVLAGRSRAELVFGHGINADAVRARIRTGVAQLYGEIDLPPILVRNPQWDGVGTQRFREWTVELALSEEASRRVFDKIEAEMQETPVWLSSNKIGGQVARDMQQTAIGALLASLLGIIGYIWLRFQRVVFGLAAVVALVHDVLITLGAIAASVWLAHLFGFLLVDEFKISLPIVAALLTIIGYSLNDTIVVFDRIREVRGKNPELTAQMINTSINQTLSRTLLTSATTMIVVLILYFLGGQAIRGFAFALLVGVLAGTYSSIFIASPSLLWMMNVSKAKKPRAERAKAVV